jgi:hypothetical protein
VVSTTATLPGPASPHISVPRSHPIHGEREREEKESREAIARVRRERGREIRKVGGKIRNTRVVARCLTLKSSRRVIRRAAPWVALDKQRDAHAPGPC